MGVKNDLIKLEYMKAQGKISLKELAAKHNIKYTTLSSMKSRGKWDQEIDQKTITDKIIQKAQKVKKSNAAKKNNAANDDTSLKSAAGAADQPNAKCVIDLQEIQENAALQMKLTSKQIIFCQEFITDFNGSRAAIEAGYSRKSARSISSSLLTKPNIQAVIHKFIKCSMQTLAIDQTHIIMQYASIAFSDITTYVDVGRKKITTVDPKTGIKLSGMADYCHLKNGQLVDASTIQEIKISDQGTFIKMHDKHKALEFLVKYSGMGSNEYAKQIEIQKLKLLQAKLKIEQTRDKNANDNGNMEDLIKSISSIDLSIFDKKEGD